MSDVAMKDMEKGDQEAPKLMGESLELDPEVEKKLVWKLDVRIIPWVALCYFICFLDRVNIGNAKVANAESPEHLMENELGLKGQEYNLTVSLFFIPYILLEMPSNVMLKVALPSRWIARIMVSWGIVATLMGVVQNFGGLLACRLILGAMEAGFFPGMFYFFCFWYKPHERALRMALMSSSVAIAGAFGGLIAAGIAFMNGIAGLSGWRWIFIVEGIPSVIIGIGTWFILTDFPQTAKFLTREEVEMASRRLPAEAPSVHDKHFDIDSMKRVFSNWTFYAVGFTYLALCLSTYSTAYFGPTIVKNMGYTSYIAQLMTVPPNIASFCLTLFISFNSDKTGERPLHILSGMILVVIGWFMLVFIPQNLPGARYFAFFIVVNALAPILPLLAWRTTFVTGASDTAIATAATVMFGNLGGIIAPYLFPNTQAPGYAEGAWTIIAFQFFGIINLLALWKWKGDGRNAYAAA